MSLSYEKIANHLHKWANKFETPQLEKWELISEVWLKGRVQKVENPHFISRRVYCDMVDVLRDFFQTRTNRKLHFISNDESVIDNGLLDNGLELIDQSDNFEFFTRNLNPCQKAIVYKQFWEDKTQREIAKELNTTQANISRVLQTALKKMRKVLIGRI